MKIPARQSFPAAIAFLVLSAVSALNGLTASQRPETTTIPDLSGIWEAHPRVPVTAETALCGGARVCVALLGLEKPGSTGENSEEPQMQPLAENQYMAVRNGITDPNELAQQGSNPAFSACMPEGPIEIMRERIFELRQFPDEVLLIFDQDHWVRRIYMDGRGHPNGHPISWMGHSIGRYEGDALVIDTTGINPKTWIDLMGHPHSENLHLIERIRRIKPDTLEMEFTIDDPKFYKKPWKTTLIHDLRPPGFQILEQTECEELLKMGTRFSQKTTK